MHNTHISLWAPAHAYDFGSFALAWYLAVTLVSPNFFCCSCPFSAHVAPIDVCCCFIGLPLFLRCCCCQLNYPLNSRVFQDCKVLPVALPWYSDSGWLAFAYESYGTHISWSERGCNNVSAVALSRASPCCCLSCFSIPLVDPATYELLRL
jgi:hypothetical protein